MTLRAWYYKNQYKQVRIGGKTVSECRVEVDVMLSLYGKQGSSSGVVFGDYKNELR